MPDLPRLCAILAFDGHNRPAVRKLGGKHGLPFTGTDEAMAVQRLESALPEYSALTEILSLEAGGRAYRVFFCRATGDSRDAEVVRRSVADLLAQPDALAPSLQAILVACESELARVPYLHLSESDFIYKFRPERERNQAVYLRDEGSRRLYQSVLCAAIKELSRQNERSVGAPVSLDFGPVSYVIPSHFGFCLGVRNAIERAYETIAENPGRRVFMLSELIHNPFVNDDLARRGLRYLQTDKGVPLTESGIPVTANPNGRLLWDLLTSDDIVIIPAFGATDADKARLVGRGVAVWEHDATCMLVEKVWKAARTYGREGYTVIIHGKSEHEETKATFSNTRRHAPAVIVRDLAETRALAELLDLPPAEAQAQFERLFRERYTPGFQVERDLQRVAVVNQTTLLMNETRGIIQFLRESFARRYGPDPAGALPRIGGGTRNDTLCYATQVNQDALARALELPLDAAFVIGGTNSSNTYQLYRLCEQRLPGRAFFIQSESNILSREAVEHTVFPAAGGTGPRESRREVRALWPADGGPKRVLITGGASCPDGVIQQVIDRINGLWPAAQLRPIETVLAELRARAVAG
jgi:4-hydroxy-3-methylbut-2-enyl diphosphate reductase